MVPYVDEFQDHGASLVMIANKDIFIPHYFADTIFFRNFAKNSIKSNNMKYPIGIQDFEKIRKEGFAFYDLESECTSSS